MKRRFRLGWVRFSSLAIGAFATTLAGTTRADDIEDLQQILDENVVSGASKSDEIASDAPATTINITAAEMHRYGIRSIDEAINFLGMGLVTQNPLHSVEVGGRGVLLTSDFGNHVLLVVDGHVMNEPWNGTAYFEQGAGIPFDLVDHIELVLGPGSVLYGGSAMFGIVNVVTKRASSFRNIRLTAEGSLSPEQGTHGNFTSFAPGDLGGSFRLAAGIGRELTLFGKPAELTAAVELYRQNGPSFAWNPQSATNANGDPLSVWGGRTTQAYQTTVPSAYARFIVGDFTASARAASYRRSTPYENAFNQYFSDFDDAGSYEHDRWVSLDLQHRGRIGKLGTVVRVFGDIYDYRQVMRSSDGTRCATPIAGSCTSDVHGESKWVGTELQGTYDWRGDERLTTMLGTDTRVRHLGGQNDTLDASGANVGTVGQKYVTEFVTSAYAQQRWRPVSVLHLNAGARFDVDPRGGNRLSPRAAVAADAWRGGVLKALYSEAFRAPSFYEAFYQDAAQLPAQGIKAESVRSAELSLEQKAGRHQFVMGAFRTWWSDMISLRALPDGKTQYQNGESIDNWGYNARAEGAVGDLRYGIAVTGAHTVRQTPTGSESLPVAPQLFGNARISYALPGPLPTVALATTFIAKRPADRALDGGFAVAPYAPAAVDLRLTFSGAIPAVKGLTYRLAADYVTASKSAYVAGPTQFVDPSAAPAPYAELAPINRLTGFVTFQYELPL